MEGSSIIIVDNTSDGYRPVNEDGSYCNTLTFFGLQEAKDLIKQWEDDEDIRLEDPIIMRVSKENDQ
jgi:hypothetical protein